MKKIIPCLDVKDGKVVKGVNFVGLREVGDPAEMAAQYEKDGADELVMLDISATMEGRKTFVELVKKVSARITLPLAIGGGIASVEDARAILDAGASKVSVNSAAVKRPELINELAAAFPGKVVSAIDAVEKDGHWWVATHSGTAVTNIDLFEWAKEVERRGANEILFTSMSHDGVQGGYPLEALKQLKAVVSVPVIASGGAGSLQDMLDGLKVADAALAASVFHFGTVSIQELKKAMQNNI